MQAISPTLPPTDGKQPKDKVIYSSTGAAYIESLYSKGLTDYAAEYASKGIFEELNFIAPPVPIASRKFEYKKMGIGDFWADEADDERARNGDFTRVSPKGEIVLASAINRGLEIVIDKSEITVGTLFPYCANRSSFSLCIKYFLKASFVYLFHKRREFFPAFFLI